jgi:hypothetical protein
MYKALIFILFFYSLLANADAKNDCLTVSHQANKLSFFYAKQEEQDKPYFYAKVLKDNVTNKEITWQTLQEINELLIPLSNTEPKQYQIPDNAKAIYIVKSEGSLQASKGFGVPARIVPAVRKNKKTTTRNTGNFIRVLPKETIKQSAVKICEFKL